MKNGNKAPNCGERLFQLRTSRGMTQKQVYEAIGCGDRVYRDWEKSKEEMSIRTEYLTALADLFHVSTDYILGRTDVIHVGNDEIQNATGLSEKAIEVLRFLNTSSKCAYSSADIEHQWSIDALNYLLEDRYDYIEKARESESVLTTLFNLIGNYIFPEHIDTETDPDGGITSVGTNGNSYILTKAELFKEYEWQNLRKKLDEYRERNMKSSDK